MHELVRRLLQLAYVFGWGGAVAPTEDARDRGSGVVAAFGPVQDVAFQAGLGIE
jgi:hypothetical protein